jgi:Protein of unknown function (DUF1360)
MRITDQYFWNFVFSLFFLSLIFMGTVILDGEAYRAYESLTPFDIALMVLATFRLIRLFVYDKITAFFREQFLDVVETKNGIALVKPDRGPRRTLADLLSCPWCFGVWASSTVAFFYLLTPYAFFPTLILALGALGTLFQLLANLIGWKAEQLKKEVEEMG